MQAPTVSANAQHADSLRVHREASRDRYGGAGRAGQDGASVRACEDLEASDDRNCERLRRRSAATDLIRKSAIFF
eukprot:1224074-Rhodomonas_salina.1